jgi:hypothetical protein
MAKKPDALAKSGLGTDITSAILAGGQVGGQQLVSAAMQRLRENYGETVLAFVTGQMDHMMRLKQQHEVLAGHILYIEDRLTAINAGAFTVEGYPPQIHFHDPRLNDGL